VTVGELIGLDMEPEDEAVAWERIRTRGLRRRMACLALNLRSAAALYLARQLSGCGCCEEWSPISGEPAPGWE